MESRFRYVCFQREHAPTTGFHHWQGYVYFDNPVRFSTVRGLLSRYFELEGNVLAARGSAQQNRDYCSKSESAVEGSFLEIGDMPEQGKRSDLDEIAEAIQAGESVQSIALAHGSQFIRYAKGIKEYAATISCVPRDPSVPCTVHWWFGPTGVGKSKKAFETYPDAYVKMGTNKWWDGYGGEKTVLFDDYRAGMLLFSELLRVLDRYPHKVEGKGVTFELSANVFVITTTSRPEVIWHKRTEEDLNQLLRRITTITEFHSDGTTILKDSQTPYVPLSKDELALMFPMEEAMTFKP